MSLTNTEVQGLGEGSITITASGTDTAGNSGSGTKTVTYDKTAPTITISDVATDNYINASEDDAAVTVAGTSSGLATGDDGDGRGGRDGDGCLRQDGHD